MSNVIQISILVVAIAIFILVVLLVPILLDLRRVTKNWKKFSEIVELGIAPVVWSTSIILDIFKKVLEISKEKKKEE